MSDYFRRLDLQPNPLSKRFDIHKHLQTGGQHNFPVEGVIDSSLINLFKRLGTPITSVAFFCFRGPSRSLLENNLLHSDILYRPTAKYTWQHVTFGINWEITNTQCQFRWWETKRLACFPVDPAYFHFDPQGIHYGKRGQLGVAPEDKEIMSIRVDQRPTLVRTNIPHTVTWINPITNTRINLSIRFEQFLQWPWEDAIKKFEPLFL